SLEAIQSKPAVFDTQKLEWMNGQYLSMTPADALLAPVREQLARLGVEPGARDLRPIIDAAKARSRTIVQLAEQVAVRLQGPDGKVDAKAEALMKKMGAGFAENLRGAARALEGIPPAEWDAPRLEAALRQVAESRGAKLGDVMQPIRVALTGSTVSEPVNELLAVVGREPSLERMRKAADAA
ncbi:MAG TPA: hypothetical protein VFS40_09810, partial [Gemmatimonadales bacterium]|nr:hypothetical protein [Gemmatimonadales bacterium]